MLIVDPDVCRVCNRCLARQVCRVKAIVHIDRDEPPAVDALRCYGCRLCLPACPFGAIRKLEAWKG